MDVCKINGFIIQDPICIRKNRRTKTLYLIFLLFLILLFLSLIIFGFKRRFDNLKAKPQEPTQEPDEPTTPPEDNVDPVTGFDALSLVLIIIPIILISFTLFALARWFRAPFLPVSSNVPYVGASVETAGKAYEVYKGGSMIRDVGGVAIGAGGLVTSGVGTVAGAGISATNSILGSVVDGVTAGAAATSAAFGSSFNGSANTKEKGFDSTTFKPSSKTNGKPTKKPMPNKAEPQTPYDYNNMFSRFPNDKLRPPKNPNRKPTGKAMYGDIGQRTLLPPGGVMDEIGFMFPSKQNKQNTANNDKQYDDLRSFQPGIPNKQPTNKPMYGNIGQQTPNPRGRLMDEVGSVFPANRYRFEPPVIKASATSRPVIRTPTEPQSAAAYLANDILYFLAPIIFFFSLVFGVKHTRTAPKNKRPETGINNEDGADGPGGGGGGAFSRSKNLDKTNKKKEQDGRVRGFLHGHGGDDGGNGGDGDEGNEGILRPRARSRDSVNSLGAAFNGIVLGESRASGFRWDLGTSLNQAVQTASNVTTGLVRNATFQPDSASINNDRVRNIDPPGKTKAVRTQKEE